jgi:hypothetical protein
VIRIKFISKAPASKPPIRFLNMFPNQDPRWGNCVFDFDPYSRYYDWLVVYDDLPSVSGERFTLWEEELACPQKQTLLITSEPSSVKVYGSGFAGQFGHVLTSQEPWALKHPGRINSQPGLVWFYGPHGPGASYDHLVNHFPGKKTKNLSTVCSTKQQRHTLHNQRLLFTRRLQADFAEMDVFGHGFNFVADKAEALDPYRYHIAVENHCAEHHWTEKLGDCYLGLCLPLYFGCPNVGDYFPEESFVPIDIFNYGSSMERIAKVIRDREYELRIPAIREARRLYLEKYFTFAAVAGHVQRLTLETRKPMLDSPVVIRSRHAWRRRRVVNGVSFALEKMTVSIRNRITSQSS